MNNKNWLFLKIRNWSWKLCGENNLAISPVKFDFSSSELKSSNLFDILWAVYGDSLYNFKLKNYSVVEKEGTLKCYKSDNNKNKVRCLISKEISKTRVVAQFLEEITFESNNNY